MKKNHLGKKLTLNRETLRQLDKPTLGGVAGGTASRREDCSDMLCDSLADAYSCDFFCTQ